jgi:hypothetical protein
MSKHIHFSGPFIKQFYCKELSTNERSADNPAAAVDYAEFVPAPLRRVYLFIQNQGNAEVTISLTPEGVASEGTPATESSMILYPFQSVSFDNYNGPILASTLNNVHIMEAFA